MIFIDRMRATLFLALVMMISAGNAWAQTACPTGVAAGSAQCGPSPQGQSGGGRAEQPPREVWVDNWFSYAQCSETRNIGVSHTFDTLREARQAALDLCYENGGVKCRTVAVNKNGCFSIVGAMGDNPDYSDGGIYSEGATLELAEDIGMGSCLRNYPGKRCVVNYSMCNYRERVL